MSKNPSRSVIASWLLRPGEASWPTSYPTARSRDTRLPIGGPHLLAGLRAEAAVRVGIPVRALVAAGSTSRAAAGTASACTATSRLLQLSVPLTVATPGGAEFFSGPVAQVQVVLRSTDVQHDLRPQGPGLLHLPVRPASADGVHTEKMCLCSGGAGGGAKVEVA